ncbi:MAG TPA: DUF4230 domain-containing protein, partial [Saprospiraceae bacterium]|nr:DUF4230 domain-containing protein [Saprospiraceae bacterium]
VALGFIGGWLIGKKSTWFTKNTTSSASLVVESVEKVLKLVAIEANLSELYKYQDYYSYDISFLRKKAILRVNAKVSVGFDLKKIKITVDSINKKVTINELPNAEILSIDHNLDYFDIEQGIFNRFESADYNHINTNAKEYIRKVALNKNIVDQANAQKNEVMTILLNMVKGMGYELEIKSSQISNPVKVIE